jgi:hypothetical protein
MNRYSYPHTIENGAGERSLSFEECRAAAATAFFPLQVALGRLLGKYRRYADAPEPVRR